MEFPGEADGIRSIRSAYRETRDAGAALHDLPVQMNYERAMLHHLYTHPCDYAGALQELPPKLLSMFVSAFQSYLFNCALSRRLDDGMTLGDPVPGDRLLFANGRTDTATAPGLAAAAIHIRRGRCGIALFMPGRDQPGALHPADPVTASMLADLGITPEHFARASAFVHTKFDGAYRPVALKADVLHELRGDMLRLRFTLPPGHYATTVCREYMQADPVRMI
jgi:tRNA pseudouridine13 synthase